MWVFLLDVPIILLLFRGKELLSRCTRIKPLTSPPAHYIVLVAEYPKTLWAVGNLPKAIYYYSNTTLFVYFVNKAELVHMLAVGVPDEANLPLPERSNIVVFHLNVKMYGKSD